MQMKRVANLYWYGGICDDALSVGEEGRRSPDEPE